MFNRLAIGTLVVGAGPVELEGPGEDVGGELDGPDGGILDDTDDWGELLIDVSDGCGEDDGPDGDMLDDGDDCGELPIDVSDGLGELDGDMLDDTDDWGELPMLASEEEPELPSQYCQLPL